MRYRCSPMRAATWMIIAVLAMAGTLPDDARGHGPQEVHTTSPAPDSSIPDETRERLEHFYRLFSDLCYLCPTERQSVTLAEAESIYDLLHGFHAEPPTAAGVRNVDARALAHYEQVCADYFRIQLQWDGQRLEPTKTLPLALARGIVRHVIVQFENQSPETLETAIRSNSPSVATKPHAVPGGATRAWIVPFETADPTANSARLEVLDARIATTMGECVVPVTVSEPACVEGTLLDDESGRVWPGRVRVECSDGILRHGRAFANNATLSEKPVIFRPAMQKLPFFYCDGRFEIEVPPGETVVTVERGFETEPITEVMDLQPGERRNVQFGLRRFVDMKAEHWISGDTHIHWAKNSWDENEDLVLLAMVQRAEDLRVANNLTLYQWRKPEDGGPFVKPDQFPMGAVPAYSDEAYHVQMGEEYRNDNHYGHINLLNITELIHPIATGPGSGGPPEAFDHPLNRTAILAARRQGGVSIEAHNLGPFHCSDVPVNVALGLADSLDQLDPEHYYRFLNSGFHIGLSNGSDHPARVAGAARVYVRVDGPFTYRRWIEGLRKSRTFVTSGPLLFLTVNGSDIGDTCEVERGQPLRVRARVFSRYPVGTFEVVSNGEVLQSLSTEDRQARIELELPADGSRWFVARASRSTQFDCLTGPNIGHTSAVYVQVDGRDVVLREAVQWWIHNVRTHAERVRTLARFENDAQREETLRHIAAGLAKYEELLARAED